MAARLPGRIAQESEVQAREIRSASPPVADAFAALDHTQEQKIDEEGRKVEEVEEVASTLLVTVSLSDTLLAPDVHHRQYRW